MKKTIVIVMAVALAISALPAQDGKTLASTMDVYVFPKAGQDKTTQSKHEAECYEWAVDNSGTDPFGLSKKTDQAKKEAEAKKAASAEQARGAGARGAISGAAGGALIGEIAGDDAGQGAAIGAAAGLMASRRRSRARHQQAAAQADAKVADVEKATAEQLLNFKKAFSVCLEAKDYLVKY